MRLALGIEYDGSAFRGWQTQPDRRAVQDALEAALASFCGAPVATTCAGRTDAGVHATYQVVHLDTPLQRERASWVRGVNRFLPPTVAIRWAREVDDAFHARYSALARRYDYLIEISAVRSPLRRERVGWVFRPLDVAAMQAAARLLVGRHDFSAFRAAECQAASAERELRVLDVAPHGRFILVRAQANAFLHHMVRNIVGSLVDVGVGRRPVGWIADVLASRDRRLASPTFAAAGLYLTAVDYDARFGLPPPEDVVLERI
ncbi:MAG TPA: tRNA pseudouridine(38-40) synthase TruA [Burkholderiaceae bacterium]|nr:tRNA pseudouridine(38-40) synthase TruA [Burkholderiaceae bacterium]